MAEVPEQYDNDSGTPWLHRTAKRTCAAAISFLKIVVTLAPPLLLGPALQTAVDLWIGSDHIYAWISLTAGDVFWFWMPASVICPVLTWLLNRNMDSIKKMSLALFLGMFIVDGFGTLIQVRLNPSVPGLIVVSYVITQLIYDALGAILLAGFVVLFPVMCANLANSTVKERGYRYSTREVVLLHSALFTVVGLFFLIFIRPLPADIRFSSIIARARLDRDNNLPANFRVAVATQEPAFLVSKAADPVDQSPVSVRNALAALPLASNPEFNSTISGPISSASIGHAAMSQPFWNPQNLRLVDGLEGRKVTFEELSHSAAAIRFFATDLAAVVDQRIETSVIFDPPGNSVPTAASELLFNLCNVKHVEIYKADEQGVSIQANSNGSERPPTISATMKRLLIAMWLQKPAGQQTFLGRLTVQENDSIPDQPSAKPTQSSLELTANAATLVDVNIDCCDTKGFIFDTSITADSRNCSRCRITGGLLPAQHFSVQFKGNSVVRFNLDRVELSADDDLRIDGGRYDIAQFDNESRIIYHTDAGYLHLNGKPFNKTLWDQIPFEAKTGVVGFLVAALGFKQSHIRRFLSRLLGRGERS